MVFSPSCSNYFPWIIISIVFSGFFWKKLATLSRSVVSRSTKKGIRVVPRSTKKGIRVVLAVG